MYKNDTERQIDEDSYAETLQLMQEFDIGPDVDAATKQNQIEVIEAGLPVVSLNEDESRPF